LQLLYAAVGEPSATFHLVYFNDSRGPQYFAFGNLIQILIMEVFIFKKGIHFTQKFDSNLFYLFTDRLMKAHVAGEFSGSLGITLITP
jgi:hypothetical protein